MHRARYNATRYNTSAVKYTAGVQYTTDLSDTLHWYNIAMQYGLRTHSLVLLLFLCGALSLLRLGFTIISTTYVSRQHNTTMTFQLHM